MAARTASTRPRRNSRRSSSSRRTAGSVHRFSCRTLYQKPVILRGAFLAARNHPRPRLIANCKKVFTFEYTSLALIYGISPTDDDLRVKLLFRPVLLQHERGDVRSCGSEGLPCEASLCFACHCRGIWLFRCQADAPFAPLSHSLIHRTRRSSPRARNHYGA